MKKLEKYRIAPQVKFVKSKVSPPWLLKFSSCPPLADDTKIIPPPPIPGGGGHYDSTLGN